MNYDLGKIGLFKRKSTATQSATQSATRPVIRPTIMPKLATRPVTIKQTAPPRQVPAQRPLQVQRPTAARIAPKPALRPAAVERMAPRPVAMRPNRTAVQAPTIRTRPTQVPKLSPVKPVLKPAVQSALMALKSAVMPINATCNDVDCITMQVLKNTNPKPQQINSSSGSNQVQTLAPTATASQAITADPAAAPAPEKAGIPWLMVGVAAVVGLSLMNGKGSKGSGLSGVPSKKGAKKSATRKVKRMSV